MDAEMKRAIILDNYENARNRSIPDGDNYIKINSNNQSCIDNIDIYVKLDNGVISDIKFDGEACVIAISSTSILSSLLIGKTVDDAKMILENYFNMIEEADYDKELLGEANVYEDIHNQKNRIGCATISWRGFVKVLEEYENKK